MTRPLPVRAASVTQSNRPYPAPLRPQTMVQHPTSGRIGVVQNYRPSALPALMGTFPVEWHDGQWEIVGANDVRVVVTPTERS